MLNTKQILVVGAGIAGPSVCYWLQKFGFSPVLIDNAPAVRKGGQALDIRGVAVGLVKKMGVFEKICAKRTQVECGRFVDAAGKVLYEEYGEKFGFRQGEEVEIVRGDLVDILMEEIVDVPIYFNKSIERMEQHPDGVTVQFKDNAAESFDLVIGADGIYSATRRAVFDKDEYQFVNLGSYLSTFTIPNYLHLHRTEVVLEGNARLLSVTNYNDTHNATVGLMFRSSHVLNNMRDKQEQMQFLHQTFHQFGWETNKILGFMTNAPDFYFDAITQVKMQSWSKDRVVLLGDAGYCASPLSGQGNNLAMIGAYILAGELKLANGNHKKAFHRYHQLLYSFVEVNQQFGAWVSKSFLTPDEVSKEAAAERSEMIMKMIYEVSHGIELSDYD